MATGKVRDKNAQTDTIDDETAGQTAHQIGSRECGGVDHRSAVAKGKNYLAFEPDSVRDRTVPAIGWAIAASYSAVRDARHHH